jgi:hypothetical protein
MAPPAPNKSALPSQVASTSRGFRACGTKCGLTFCNQSEQGLKSGKSYPHACPAPKSLAKIKDRITQLTARERTPIPLEDIVGSMSVCIRGWSGCFHYRISNGVREKVKTHTEGCLRKHPMKRHKVKDRGIGLGRFPGQQLYAKYGLYKFRQWPAGKQRVPWCEEHR